MADVPRNARTSENWRLPLITGLSVGCALPAAWNVEKALEPNLNPWAASGLGLLAAGLVGGAVAFAVAGMTRQRNRKGVS